MAIHGDDYDTVLCPLPRIKIRLRKIMEWNKVVVRTYSTTILIRAVITLNVMFENTRVVFTRVIYTVPMTRTGVFYFLTFYVFITTQRNYERAGRKV